MPDVSIAFDRQWSNSLRKVTSALFHTAPFEPTQRNSVTVMVPATSANMGAGYDTIGMAVDMWNEVTVTRADTFSIHVEGEGSDDVPRDESNLVVIGVKTVFESLGIPE